MFLGLFQKITFILGIAFFYCLPLQAQTLEVWFSKQVRQCYQTLFQNISPEGAKKGAVAASPSKESPNYWFHWIRDAALTMDIVVSLYNATQQEEAKAYYGKLLKDYVRFSRENQITPNRSDGLGEPKFQMDGKSYDEEWGRPQNDGPALRALTLIRWAHPLLKEGHEEWVRTYLYDSQLPTYSVIKTDLEYISHHWKDFTYDLWEEVKGLHFYTHSVQWRALVEGAELARELGDEGAAFWYEQQASLLRHFLTTAYWNPQKQVIVPTLYKTGGIFYKNSDLDSSVILAILHGRLIHFTPTDERVLSTVFHLENTFRQIYTINEQFVGIAIGRYPEDRYDGYRGDSQGNPWFLTTLAFAELYFKMVEQWKHADEIYITSLNLLFFQSLLPNSNFEIGMKIKNSHGLNSPGLKESGFFLHILHALQKKGDLFLERVRIHSDQRTGEMSEQFHRDYGTMQGAKKLTWSCVAFLKALGARMKNDAKRN